jgi:hypothetical protein
MIIRTLLFALAALGTASISSSQTPSPSGTPTSAAPGAQSARKPTADTHSPSTAPSGKAVAPPPAQADLHPAGHPQGTTQEVRPDAVYPKPSGQDSQPKQSNVITHRDVPAARSTQPSTSSASSGKTYEGNTGKKSAPGTACGTARQKPNGDLDCGTGGNAALPGKIPK